VSHSGTRPRRADRLRRDVALILIRTEEGSPLPPIRQLASRFGASVGATQMAMARLVDEGSVEIDSRPGRGAVLTHKSVGALFAAIHDGPLLVALPLPSTELTGPAYDLLLTLPAGSYVLEHRVFYVPEPASGRRLRIAIDPSSRDFERLTELEFGDVDAELVPLNYLRSVRAMADGTIDAAILDSEDALMHFPPGMANRSLSERVTRELGGANLEAAFVGRAGNAVIREIVASCFVPAEILRIQEEVIAGRRPPEY